MEPVDMSVVSELPTESSLNPTSREDEDYQRQATVVICCLLLLLLILLLLTLTGLFLGGNEDEGDLADTPPINYASGGSTSSVVVSGPSSTADTTGTTASAGSTDTTGTTGSTGTTSTTSTTTTTTEDTWHFSQDYTMPVWTYLHYFLCPFWSEKQGFVSHRRTYGIAYFPYMFCHYAMYCCYTLDDQMSLQPERPDVDLAPVNAVRRMAGFKAENYHLKVWMVVRGEDAVFHRLLENRNNEKATFQTNALAWMRANNYDGIRIWWTNAPDSLNRSFAELYNDTNDAFQVDGNRTFGMLIPYGHYANAAYNTSKLAHRRAYHTIVMYPVYPRNLTNRTTTTTYTIRELTVYSQKINQSDRPSFCHLIPFVALTYKINPADCSNLSSTLYKIQPLQHGSPGPLTKTAGILSLPEVCDMVDSTWRRQSITADGANLRPNYHFACKGEDVVAYTTGEEALENVIALDSEYLEEVFGVMNPEYDDFPGICPAEFGPKVFPTVRSIFEVIYHS